MADISSSPNNTNNRVAIERASVIPISAEALLNQYLRDLTVPNIDSKRTFYKGLVTFVLDENNENFRLDDIFLDSVAEQDRSSNTNTTKNNKKLLFIHVPFFTTSSKINATDVLDYDNFNKLKVFYNEDKPVKVGDIVLVEFEIKQNFLFPRVKEIISAETGFKPQQTDISIITFQNIQPSPVLNIAPPQSQDQIQKKELTRPGGGYGDALNEFEKVFQSDFIESYISILQSPEKQIKINMKIDKIAVKEELRSYLLNLDTKPNYSIIPDNEVPSDYLIYVYISSSTENISNVNFTSGFFNYIKQYFSSTLKFSLNQISFGDDFRFSLDINLNQLNNKPKTLKNYLETLNSNSTEDLEKNYIFESIPKKSVPGIITDNTAVV
jgi:hypothetical protein